VYQLKFEGYQQEMMFLLLKFIEFLANQSKITKLMIFLDQKNTGKT